MDHLDVGEANSWEFLGFNLDDLYTLPMTSDKVCVPYSGPTTLIFDGPAGLDNNYAENIVPFFGSAGQPPITAPFNESLAKGEHSMMLEFAKLTAGPDQPSLVTRLYLGSSLGTSPKFDGSDCWPVAPESLTTATDLTSPRTIFENSSLSANHWVSGPPRTMRFVLPAMLGKTIPLTIYSARLVLDLSADHHSGAHGVLGGVVDPEELITEVKKVANSSPGNCNFYKQLFEDDARNSVDIMIDGSQDHKKMCNGISIGLGFTMKEVKLGGIGPASPSGDKGCP